MLILFLNSISVYNSAGNITLMCRRAEAMKKIGIDTKFVNVINRSIDQTYPDYTDEVPILNTDPDNRLESIRGYIDELAPEYVCFHGNRSNVLIDKLYDHCKSKNIQIMTDVQGALEEMIEYCGGSFVKKGIARARYLLAKFFLKKLLDKCDAVFVVSDELESYCRKLSSKPFKILKIHCGISEVFEAQMISQMRLKTRKELNIADDAVVFCYSGVLNSWGNFDQTLELWKEYDALYENMFFMLLARPDDGIQKKLKQVFPRGNFVIKYLSREDYYKHLAASDVCFLIRDETVTNKVAFPNKFSEYLNCGNLCYISGILKNPVKILNECGIPYINADEGMQPEAALKTIMLRMNDLEGYYAITRAACEKHLLYDSQLKQADYFEECSK